MSSKPLDPISSRQSSTSRDEMQPVVPRNVDSARVLVEAQRRLEAARENQSKSRRQLIFWALLLGLIIFLVGAGYITKRTLDDKRPTDGEYAVIEGRSIKQSEFESLRDAYIRYDARNEQKNTRISERRAADELMTRVGLEVQAERYGVSVSQADIDSYLQPAYLQYGSKDGLLQYNKSLYGWDEKPLFHKAKLDLLKQKLQSKMIAEMDLLGVYVRWDNHIEKSEEFQKDYGKQAVGRLEKDFLPRLKAGQAADDFIKTTDVNPSLSAEVNNERLTRVDDPIVRYLTMKSVVNDPKNDPFQHNEKASDAKSVWGELEKLEKVGDTTPIFKSDSGMYIALRLERKSEGKFISYEAYLKDAIGRGKVDKSYEGLPDYKIDKKTLPIPTSSASTSFLANFLPRAQASGSRDCWAQDPLYYEMRPKDGSAGYADITGKPFAVWISRSGADICLPVTNGFGYFMNGAGRQAWTSSNVVSGTVVPLNCYGVVWDFAWTAPAGYNNFSPSDYQNSSRVLASFNGGLMGAASEISGSWRNSSIYYGIANGAAHYTVGPVFFPSAPTPQPDPVPKVFNVTGYKADRYGNAAPQVAGAVVRDASTGELSISQPFVFNNRDQTQDHIIQADDTADWMATGWDLTSNGTSGNQNAYGFPANTTPINSTQSLIFRYEPRHSNIRAGVLVRDPNTGTLSDPCTQTGFQNTPCNSGTNITLQRNFNLPGGLVHPYSGATLSQTTASGSTTFGSLYTGSYTATASGIPAGWRVVGTYQCSDNADPASCFPANGAGVSANSNGIIPMWIDANRSRPVFYVLQLNQLVVKGDKKGPGTFTSAQNSDTTNLGIGTVEVGGQVVSGDNQANAWNKLLIYNPSSGTYGVRATAPTGWQIRGYAFCTSATALSSCNANDAILAPNSQTQGQIILGGNNTTDYSISIDYTNPDGQARLNGAVIPSGGELWITFFYKPTPVTIQVRAKVDMQGGNSSANTDLNPCVFSDYKRNLCTQLELRPVRMNTQGLANSSTPSWPDIGDPAGAAGGSCTGKDYVPTKPGYDYGASASSGFYCTNEGGNNNITQAKFMTGNSPLRYGMTLDARTGGVSTNSNPAENNLAIVRNVYPGKYSFQTAGLPQYNNEDAYTVAQSTCAVNQLDCSMSVTPINDVNGCLLNHRRRAEYIAAIPVWWWYDYIPIIQPYSSTASNDRAGQDYCTVMWSGTPGVDNWSNGGTPQTWDIADPPPHQCMLTNGVWAYNPQWNSSLGRYGMDINGNFPCGYRKATGVAKQNTYTMGVPIGTSFREQVFYYSPKIFATGQTLTCDNYAATVVFMPDPTRPVTTYFRVGRYGQPALTNLMRTDSSTGTDIMEITTQTSGANAHQVSITIPKYNGQGGELLRDGDRRSFEVFARYGDSDTGSPDGDLVNGYTTAARDFGSATGVWKYAPVRISTLTHQCQNNATCDQASFNSQLNNIAAMDADDPQSNEMQITMTNTGQSYWQQSVNENGAAITTGHELVVTGGTILATSPQDTRGWYIAAPDYRMSDGSQVYPISINPGAATYTFTVRPTPPRDGGSKFALGFQMRQLKPSTGYAETFGTACGGEMEIKVSYKPWYRVQNGNVTALGKIQDQSESARGMYKSENRTNNNPYPGSVENVAKPKTDSAKPVINLHAQFSVVAEGGGVNFCSTNFYMLGFAKNPSSYSVADTNDQQKSRDCSFAAVDLNIDQVEDTNGDGKKELKNDQLIATAKRAYSDNGQCVDTGTNPDVDGGPYDLSAPTKYYRSWMTTPIDVPSLIWSNEASPDSGDGPFGRHNSGPPSERGLYLVNINANPLKRPCPTIFKLDTPSHPSDQYVQGGYRRLGGFIYSAGRSTILSDQTVYITDNITSSLSTSLQYRFQRNGVPDMAGLNTIPNLGIISEGDIVVASNVTKIDASLYAKGRVITCDQYVPNSGLNGDAAKTDQFGTTGTKWIRRGAGIGLDSNPLATETADPNVAEAPNADNTSAKACANKLRISGSVTGGSGFTLGRNYIDFAEMVQRWSSNEGGAFSGQTPQEFGKFCNLSDVIGIRRTCYLAGERKDFDSPGNTGATYWLENKSGWPQNYYTGGPAEDFVGNGISNFMPPPGFENISASAQTARYFKNTARPRF